jgi:hypothetical protein
VRTVTYNLQQFLTESKRNSFVIPRFQRDFVWHDAQIKLLIDSIARNYPIGSLLLLHETEPGNPFLSSRPVDAVVNEIEEDGDNAGPTVAASPSAVYYVLDGQQRLTSLVRVFLQSSPKAHYYFDLKRLMEFESGERPSSNWVLRRDRNTKLPNRYLRSDAVADSERCQVMVEEYFEQNEVSLRQDRPAQRRASAKVNRIFETIRNYQVPLVIIDRGESTEAICRIFETINSTGTRLTTFDLAVARFFPNPDLQNYWQDSLTKHTVLKLFNAEGERVLQVIALLFGAEKKTYLEATRGTLLSLPSNEITAKWDQAANALADAYIWAEKRGSVPNLLANEGLLVPLAFFLAGASNQWKQQNPGYGAMLERWYFANALQQGAKQASNYRVAEAAGKLRSWLSDSVAPDIPTVSLMAEDLLRLFKSDNRYRAIHAILRWKGGRDLWTEDVLSAEDVEDHHIFPAALAKREHLPKRLLDSIANRLLVATKTNRALGDRMPRDYMDKLIREASKHGTQQSKIDALRSACIPVPQDINKFGSQFEQTRVKEFLEARAVLLLDMIGGLLGDALRRESSVSADTQSDGDEADD